MKRCAEYWAPIPGFEQYEASTQGRVRRAPTVLAQTKRARGYRRITLYDASGKMVTVSVHRAVALAFHGKSPEGKPCVCHVDGDPSNNSADNLYWGSHKENARDRKSHARAKSVQNPCTDPLSKRSEAKYINKQHMLARLEK